MKQTSLRRRNRRPRPAAPRPAPAARRAASPSRRERCDDNVHDADVAGNIGGRNQPGENETLFQPFRADAVLQLLAQAPSPTRRNFVCGWRLRTSGAACDQILMAFEFEEAGDFADDKILRARCPGATRSCGSLRGGKKRCEVKAAEDAGVIFRSADARGDDTGGSWRRPR